MGVTLDHHGPLNYEIPHQNTITGIHYHSNTLIDRPAYLQLTSSSSTTTHLLFDFQRVLIITSLTLIVEKERKEVTLVYI